MSDDKTSRRGGSRRSREAAPDRGRRGTRRVATPRERSVDPVLLLACLIPLLTVAALATVNPAPTEEGSRVPTTTPITRTVLVCPAAVGGADGVRVALADPAVSGALRASGEDLTIQAGAVASLRDRSPVVLRAEGALASGLLAVRDGAAGGTDCVTPQNDTRFTGVGSGPEHSSVLTLVNPDAGPAVADIVVHAAGGVQEVAGLRGVAVPARGTLRLALADLVPRREDLSLRILVTRGRLASSVLDTVEPLASADRATAWLPSNAAPSTDALLLGVNRGGGERTLVLTNEGEDETQVQLRAVTPDSEFAPAELEPVAVPPGATVTVGLGRLLGSDVAAGLVGLRVRSGTPVSAMLRTRAGSDLTHVAATTPLTSDGAALVQEGPKRLLLAGVDAVTDVTVLQRDAGGRALEPVVVTLRPGNARPVPLAGATRWVQVQVGDVAVRGAVEWGAERQHVRTLQPVVTDSLVPHVRPALQ